MFLADTRDHIRFLLNDREVRLSDVPASRTLLDFLRLDKVLRGTKEGCAEGDCGACTVLVGRLRDGELVYEAVNACIRFVGSLDGCHVVTVEHLRKPDGSLHPVQQAMVDLHGSQCGFCTPGIVMSLYGAWMAHPDPQAADLEKALQGNLCRCTGYAPIIRAGLAGGAYWDRQSDPLVAERSKVMASLKRMADGKRAVVEGGDERFIVPASVDDLAAVLEETPDATIVAGATDVGLWVTKFMRDISPVVFTGHLADFHKIEEHADGVRLAGGATYSESFPFIKKRFPQLAELWHRLGGEQVRNMGTIGGNIANGSPIGDTPPPLIALNATITLRKGSDRRTVPLEDFFIDYGKQDRTPGEFVESIFIPVPEPHEHIAVYKISKRFEEDISALCGAFRVSIVNGEVAAVRIAFGGMAATPKRAKAVEAALLGKPWDAINIEEALAAFADDFQPISDMRASADYRLMSARNLLKRFYFETVGETARLQRGAA